MSACQQVDYLWADILERLSFFNLLCSSKLLDGICHHLLGKFWSVACDDFPKVSRADFALWLQPFVRNIGEAEGLIANALECQVLTQLRVSRNF